MTPELSVGILGTGACLPEGKRYNTDPIFCLNTPEHFKNNRSVISEKSAFQGLHTRRFFQENESLEFFTAASCISAVESAGINLENIDRLYGYLSVSKYLAPNSLFEVHRRLALRPDCSVIPVNSEYTNFLMGLISAKEAIAAGNAQHVLVACGQNWSQHMDYSQDHAFSIGDGTGAAVIGNHSHLKIITHDIDVDSQRYGAMSMALRDKKPTQHCNTYIYYEITPETGAKSLIDDGIFRPVSFINNFIQKMDLKKEDIDLICYQASSVLLDHWRKSLSPVKLHDTLDTLGNMSLATLPVNLDCFINKLTRRYLILFSLGIGFHQALVLLERC